MLGIYNGIIFLVNNWDRILAFVNSVFDSIAAIASGAISQASAFVEKTMAQTIPLILDFIAQQLNLSGIAERITKIIHRIRKPIDQVIDKVINFITNKVKKIAGKLLGKDKDKTKDKDKHKEKAEDTKKDFEKDKGDDKTTDVDRKEHKVYVKQIIKELQVTPKGKTQEEEYKQKQVQANDLENQYNQKLKDGLKTTIKFEPVANIGKDNDIDFSVKIAPNDTYDVDKIILKDDDKTEDKKIQALVYRALHILRDDYHRSMAKHDLKTAKDAQSNKDEDLLGMTDGKIKTTIKDNKERQQKLEDKQNAQKRKDDFNKLTGDESKEDKKVKDAIKDHKEADHKNADEEKQHLKNMEDAIRSSKNADESVNEKIRALGDLRAKYAAASVAKFYPNNIFNLGGKQFFVDQWNNYYIYSFAAKDAYYKANFNGKDHYALYYNNSGGQNADDRKELPDPSSGNIYIGPANIAIKGLYDYNVKTMSANQVNAILQNIHNIVSGSVITDLQANKTNPLTDGESAKVQADLENVSDKIKILEEGQDSFESGNLAFTTDTLAMFMAAMVAEPTRHSVAAITHILAIDKMIKTKQGDENLWDHGSMTGGGTDNGQLAAQVRRGAGLGQIDQNIAVNSRKDLNDSKEMVTDKNKQVTRQDLRSVMWVDGEQAKRKDKASDGSDGIPSLLKDHGDKELPGSVYKQLKEIYNNTDNKEDIAWLTESFVKVIRTYINQFLG